MDQRTTLVMFCNFQRSKVKGLFIKECVCVTCVEMSCLAEVSLPHSLCDQQIFYPAYLQ